jgi:FemAB family protein
VPYTPSFVRYQTEYHGLADLSQVIYHDRRPVAVWPLGVKDNWPCSNGGAVLPPLMVRGLPERVQKKIVADCLRTVQEACEKYGAFQTWSSEIVMPHGGVSLWHRRIMEHGGRASIDHELFVDLTMPLDDIRACIRKSYRSLLTHKDFVPSLGTHISPLQVLHLEVAGRVTRSQATWDRQQDAIDAGEAFCVYLHDRDAHLVGGALFHISRTEGLYAVCATDRNLNKLPLGHIIQWYAIEHMQRLGLRWYYLGLRPYVASDKELSIAHFKEGWATHVFPRVTTETLRRKHD